MGLRNCEAVLAGPAWAEPTRVPLEAVLEILRASAAAMYQCIGSPTLGDQGRHMATLAHGYERAAMTLMATLGAGRRPAYIPEERWREMVDA